MSVFNQEKTNNKTHWYTLTALFVIGPYSPSTLKPTEPPAPEHLVRAVWRLVTAELAAPSFMIQFVDPPTAGILKLNVYALFNLVYVLTELQYPTALTCVNVRRKTVIRERKRVV
jgi:hypothetical protein